MIYSSLWLTFPQEVRDRMRKAFNISRSTGTHVDGGRVVCDGSTDLDLQVVTDAKMQELLKSEAVGEALLAETVAYFSKESEVEKEEAIKKEEAEQSAISETEKQVLADAAVAVVEAVTKRRGRQPGFKPSKKV